ncbi:hypothetical protein Bbelb_152960 [Branchiostoma belcheri]|nr:hypothetical protein Bbelb_152960 [Branchiostoma belcheri]
MFKAFGCGREGWAMVGWSSGVEYVWLRQLNFPGTRHTYSVCLKWNLSNCTLSSTIQLMTDADEVTDQSHADEGTDQSRKPLSYIAKYGLPNTSQTPFDL